MIFEVQQPSFSKYISKYHENDSVYNLNEFHDVNSIIKNAQSLMNKRSI